MKVRVRSYGYVLAILVLALLLGWSKRVTWQEIQRLDRSFTTAQSDAFHLSEHISNIVRELNEIALRFDVARHPEARASFEQKSEDLRQWIRAHRAGVTTPNEGELMGRIEAEFEGYGSWVIQFMGGRAHIGAEAMASPEPTVEQVEHRATPILDLCGRLETAERAAQAKFMNDARQTLGRLQDLLVMKIALVVTLVGAVVVAFYHGIIAPLRVELGESRVRAVRQEKLASLGTLAAGVAHEIRNPLTAINVRLHSLKRNLVANSSEQEDALVIGYEIQRLERIVRGFLQFARPADPKLLTVSADSLLAQMQSLFGPELEKKSLRLKLESVPDLWVRADPHQMEQVLINLIQNAAESMDAGGTITLAARRGTARLRGRASPVVMLEVSDTGKGVPPEVRKRMFDPFFTTKEEGTGLGLAIAARIVEGHGGTLECRSEVNRGTTFAIVLPDTKVQENDEPTS